MSDASPRARRAYRAIVWMLRALVGAFFRRVEATGTEQVPETGGGILVSWHPNGLVDPGLILTHFPRQVVFGARHGLFKWPGLGALLRQVGTVPIFRAHDDSGGDLESRRAANKKSLDALAGEVARGSFSALFPEGVSHDAPHLRELKTGAARLYYRARTLAPEGTPPPAIIPVGLHYDRKAAFRSNALVAYHPPLRIPPALDVTPDENEDTETGRERCRLLTEEIERVLHDVVQATDDWSLYYLIHRGRTLVRAERAARLRAQPGPQSLEEKTLGFARVRAGYYARLQTHPGEVSAIRARVERYDADIRALGLKDHELDSDPPLVSKWIWAFVALQVLATFFVLPPILLFGYLVNGPPALLLAAVARWVSRRRKDVATVKILGGAILFPLTWIAAGVLAGLGHELVHEEFPTFPDAPFATGWFVTLTSAVGAAVAARYHRVAGDTIRAVRVRLTKQRRWFTVARLRKERHALCDDILAFAEGLDLPGEVAEDGRVRARADA